MSGPADETAVALLRVSADGRDWREVSPPVQSVDVEDHDRLTDKATIVLDDNTGVLADASFEGLEVRLTMGWQAEPATIFEGEIIGSRVIAAPGGQKIELTALDFTNRMARHTPNPPMVWHNGERLSEVLKSIVERTGNRIVAKQIEPTEDLRFDEAHPLRQANVNDWEFVLDLARRQNCLAFVEFDGKDASKFYFVPVAKVGTAEPFGELRYCRGTGELIEFDYERISSGALPLRGASTIDPASGQVVTAPAPAAPPRPAVPAPATSRDRDLGAGRRAALEALTELAAATNDRLQQPTEQVAGAAADPGADAARVVPDPTRKLGLSGRGVASGTVHLRAKSRVRISGVAPWAEGAWYVTKVNHVYTRERINNRTRSSYFSKFTATM
ncbi:hypothetical protein [Actinophytocola sp.]|uniref:hypothetical protein n=1 Tax=Actinophytocola sp. TaxID=1872138 RepID=UPI00389A35F1